MWGNPYNRNGPKGQLIRFQIESDANTGDKGWAWANVRPGEDVQTVAARRGYPERAREIANKNGIKSITSKFSGRGKTKIKVPALGGDFFEVMAGDTPPTPTDGYAKYEVIDRPGRIGLTQFTGYNPVTMTVPLRFDNFMGRDGLEIEQNIALLERMAGRGVGAGGPPPIVRVSTTDASGNTVPLIPHNYQISQANPGGPLWRVAGLDWDDGAIRGIDGNRIRQLCVVTLQQQVKVSLLSRSVTARTRSNRRAGIGMSSASFGRAGQL